MHTYNGRLNPESKGVPALYDEALDRSRESFVDGYEANEEECVGLVVAFHFEWDGLAIMRAFRSALEDANFHTQARQVAGWLRTATGDMKVVDG